MESVGFALVWLFPGRYFSPLVPMPESAEAAASARARAGLRPALRSRRTEAGQTVDLPCACDRSHKLITQGPYSLARKPTYLGMFGMLLAAGLAVGRWWIAVIAAAIFLAGTEIRIRREEQLLRETFGHAFEEYMRRVPAFVPKLL